MAIAVEPKSANVDGSGTVAKSGLWFCAHRGIAAVRVTRAKAIFAFIFILPRNY